MPAPAQVGVRTVRVRRKQAELSKNARLRKRLQKLRESSRKLLGIHKVAPEPTFDDKLDALFARYDTDHNNLIDADELVKLLEHFIPPHVRRGSGRAGRLWRTRISSWARSILMETSRPSRATSCGRRSTCGGG